MSKSKSKPLPPFIRLEAEGAWNNLGAVLTTLAEAGTTTPCQREPDTWVADLPAVRREAVTACAECPALDACLRFAIENKEPHGVWGGQDRAPRSSPKETSK